MERGSLLALPGRPWEAEYLEDTSLRRLVLEHYDREHVSLRRYLLFLGVDSETAREIVQESFLRLHEHLLADGDRPNLRAWLFRVAHNLARNAQQSFHASRTDSLGDSAAAVKARATIESPEQKLLVEERTERVRRAMDELGTAQKQCLLLRAEGLKYREIAEVLNLAVSTVGENIQRGLERLKEVI
ncbi:MAG: RNA polymerase sigma factor [Acidobacteriaceae bacterium]|nr:RNA polymerase sigma factor [Acidobacteriaceae bacterium]MBV9778710.1 RNA polymerase sigma factor [Acidobacteriaceae bacterium]